VPPIWTATIKVKKNSIPFEYKYIITDDNGHDVRLMPSLRSAQRTLRAVD
jgi:hypothetical protein